MFRILIATLLLVSCTHAKAEVLDSAEDGFTVSNSIDVAVPPERAWRALVRDINRWWPRDHTWFGADGKLSIEPKAGGCFCERAGKRQVRHLEVAHVDPPRLLRLLGGLGPLQGMGLQGVMDFSLAATEEGTRITLRHRVGGYSPDPLDEFAAVVDQVQAQQLGGLGEFLLRRP